MHFPNPYQEIEVTAVDSTTYIPWCCFVTFHGGAVVCCDLEADCRDTWRTADWTFPSLEAENYCK
jgi:hypothetical protein